MYVRKPLIVAAALMFLPGATAFGQNPPKEKEPSRLVNEDASNTLAEAAGLFASLQLYNTYLNIGILADAVSEGVYDASNAYQLLASVVHPLERVEQQLVRISKFKLPREDLDAVARLTRIAGLLRRQGKELELYWDNGLAENGKKYEAARQAAWKELSVLLNLDSKKEKLPDPRLTTPMKKP